MDRNPRRGRKSGEPTPEDRLYRIPLSAEVTGSKELHPEPRYAIVTSGTTIGWTDLEYPFPDDGRAAGWFLPASAFAEVAPIFALYQPENLTRVQFQRYLKEREGLSLQILEEGVTRVGAKVEMIREGPDGRYTIHVCWDDPYCDPPGPA